MDLKNKTIVLTGATGGIGRELCLELSQKGARILMVARTEEKLKQLYDEIGSDRHQYFSCDFTDINDLESLPKIILEKYEALDILINAAGVGVYKNIEDVELKEWSDSLAINTTAPFYLTKSLLPLLKKSEKSIVVNIGSGMGKIPTACRSVYCATKYALRGMTLSLALEFKGTNVHFVHIDLGSTLTEFGPMSLDEKKEENLKGKAYFTPEWVASKLVSIVENNELEEEITLYPSDYSESS